MPIYLCSESALAALRSPAALARLGKGLHAMVDARVPTADEAAQIARALQIPLPLSVLVEGVGSRRRGKAVACRVCSTITGVPAFLEVLPGVFVTSPEALLVQLAPGTDFENRLMLGMELTGGYAPNRAARKGLLMRDPLTTPEAVLAFIGAAPASHGLDKACGAARYLKPGARSPREAELALLLTLPRCLGGRGIDGLDLNRRIDLPLAGQVIAGRGHLVCDIFSEAASLELAYDSDDNHLEREACEADKRRENALRTAGVGLMVMTNGQLRNWEIYQAVMNQFERETGTSFRFTTDRIARRQHELWHRLLFCKRVGGRTVEG